MKTSPCPTGCGRDRVFSVGEPLVCEPCWHRLPHALRDAIHATAKDPDAHAGAKLAALEWLRGNPESETP